MPDLVFNIAKGRVAELYNRVKSNDPAASTLTIVPVDVAAVSDATLRDFDTLAAILAGGVTERNATGWSRKVLADTDLVVFAPDDANDRVDIDVPDQTWTTVTAGAVTDLIICYDPAGTGTTSAMIPLTLHDFSVTPDGSDVVAQIAATGFYRAA